MYGLTAASAFADSHESSSSQPGVWLTDHGDRVTVMMDGKLFTEYHYDTEWRPFLYPVIGPGGIGAATLYK